MFALCKLSNAKWRLKRFKFFYNYPTISFDLIYIYVFHIAYKKEYDDINEGYLFAPNI